MRNSRASRSSLVAAGIVVLTVATASCQAKPQPVSSKFTLDQEAVMKLVADTPASVQAAVRNAPGAFLDLVALVLDSPHDQWLLVDKSHALGSDYIPRDIVSLDTLSGKLTLSRAGHQLTRTTVDALITMSNAATADGITLVVSSAYRSYAYQRDVYARWVDQLGQAEADRVSARPGTSQHQLGTTMDFGCICDEFADQAAGKWLMAHAGDYGFSLSYPNGYEEISGYSYEPWHYRYVGVPAAKLQRDFFGGIQQWMFEFVNANREALQEARRED